MTFKITSPGHFFAAAAHEVVVGWKFLSAHKAQIQTGVQTAVAVAEIAEPQFAPIIEAIERIGAGLLGEVQAAIHTAGDAAAQHGISVTLDAEAIAEIRQLFADIQKLPGSILNTTQIAPGTFAVVPPKA